MRGTHVKSSWRNKPRQRAESERKLKRWRVSLARILLPILAEPVFACLLVRVRPQLFDIDIDAETGGGRQVDPALAHRKPLRRDLAADALQIDEVFGDA